MRLMKYKIYLPGGVGCQILYLMIGIEKAIRKNISPKDIEVIICKYQDHQSKTFFHNAEDIRNYLYFEDEIELKTTFYKPKIKYKFDQNNANKIIYSLQNNYTRYFKVHNFNFSLNQKLKNIIWIRGLDRRFDIKKFEKISNDLFDQRNFGVITNDIKLLKNSDSLFKNKTGGTSILNFECLLKANKIITQFSGFSIAPFLLSTKKQKILLLDKSLHSKEEFPKLEKDWIFLINLLDGISQFNKEKSYEIIN